MGGAWYVTSGFVYTQTDIAHPGNGINTSQTMTLQANLANRHRQVAENDLLARYKLPPFTPQKF